MNDFKLLKEDLIAIILSLQQANTVDTCSSSGIQEFKQLVSGVISILLVQCFGEYNAELIWNYVVKSDQNKFSTVDELYEYLQDPYSKFVKTDSALTLSQLRQLFPEEKMFDDFNKYTNECKKEMSS